MLGYRRETALQGALVSAKSGRLELGDNILQTLCLSSTTDIIVLQSCRIRWKKRKIRAIAQFKVIQGHQGRCQSKAQMRIPISD